MYKKSARKVKVADYTNPEAMRHMTEVHEDKPNIQSVLEGNDLLSFMEMAEVSRREDGAGPERRAAGARGRSRAAGAGAGATPPTPRRASRAPRDPPRTRRRRSGRAPAPSRAASRRGTTRAPGRRPPARS